MGFNPGESSSKGITDESSNGHYGRLIEQYPDCCGIFGLDMFYAGFDFCKIQFHMGQTNLRKARDTSNQVVRAASNSTANGGGVAKEESDTLVPPMPDGAKLPKEIDSAMMQPFLGGFKKKVKKVFKKAKGGQIQQDMNFNGPEEQQQPICLDSFYQHVRGNSPALTPCSQRRASCRSPCLVCALSSFWRVRCVRGAANGLMDHADGAFNAALMEGSGLNFAAGEFLSEHPECCDAFDLISRSKMKRWNPYALGAQTWFPTRPMTYSEMDPIMEGQRQARQMLQNWDDMHWPCMEEEEVAYFKAIHDEAMGGASVTKEKVREAFCV